MPTTLTSSAARTTSVMRRWALMLLPFTAMTGRRDACRSITSTPTLACRESRSSPPRDLPRRLSRRRDDARTTSRPSMTCARRGRRRPLVELWSLRTSHSPTGPARQVDGDVAHPAPSSVPVYAMMLNAAAWGLDRRRQEQVFHDRADSSMGRYSSLMLRCLRMAAAALPLRQLVLIDELSRRPSGLHPSVARSYSGWEVPGISSRRGLALRDHRAKTPPHRGLNSVSLATLTPGGDFRSHGAPKRLPVVVLPGASSAAAPTASRSRSRSRCPRSLLRPSRQLHVPCRMQ